MDTNKHTDHAAGVPAPTYLRSTLPAGSNATKGTLGYVTDDIRGLWFDNGTSYIPLLGSTVNIREHGAKGDLRSVTDAVTHSTTTVESMTAAFTSADIGKNVYIVSSDGSANYYGTCAAFVNATTITVSTAVPFTATGCTLWIATDDKPAFQNAINSLGSTNEKGSVFVPAGTYFLSGPVLIKDTNNILICGQGAASTIHFSSVLKDNLKCYARGEQSGDGTNRQAVVWSPLSSSHSVPHVIGARPVSAIYVASGYYRSSSDLGSSIQIIFTNPKDPAATDQFECLLGS